MEKRINCCCCENDVEKVSIALCKKLLAKNTKRFYCLNCFAEYLDVSEEELLDKAEDFKRDGCTLFL